MSVRAIQARIVCDSETLRHLWRTHCVFNERLPEIIGILFRMRRGECGRDDIERDIYRRAGHFITAYSSQNADYLLNSVSKSNWAPASAKKYKASVSNAVGELEDVTGESWADEAAALSARGILLFDKDKLHGDLPGCMRQMLGREAVAIISGYDELTRKWHKEHREWLERKRKWEAEPDNQRYLALRPRFEAFEAEIGGRITKKRGRWHLYLDWLRANPDLAAWRGGEAVVRDLDDGAKARVRKARPWKQRSVEADEFWKVNAELKALDRTHGYYEREFVRRRKTKKNCDGFDHRPTFTMPDPLRHPRWFVFNAPQTNPSGYERLRLPSSPREMGQIDLCLLTGSKREGTYPREWTTVRFKGDPRLSDFHRVMVKTVINRGRNKGSEKEKLGFVWSDRQLGIDRSASISGVKLIFRDVRLAGDGSLLSAAAYLMFTCNVDDETLSERAKSIQWSETEQVTRKGKRRKQKHLPDGIISCAVDIGIRHIGFATLAIRHGDHVRVLRSRNLWIGQVEKGGRHPGRWADGPDLAHIGRHKREIRKLRSQRGDPVKGELSHVELQQHIDGMAEDRFKKAARAVVNFALNADHANDKDGREHPRADVLILENLENLIPDAERERGINRSLLAFNRGNLVKRIHEMAADAGLKVFEISPVGTSQVCSKCGAVGRRYSIVREAPEDGARNVADIHFGAVEKLFACPRCGYRANADHNASVNLHRRWHLEDGAVTSYQDFRGLSEEGRKQFIADIEEQLREPLRQLHSLPSLATETPF